MKTIICLVLFAFISCGMYSCKNCSECNKYPNPTIKICQKDYASTSSYTDAYHHLEAQGYHCN